MPAIRDFETWMLLLAFFRGSDPEGLASPGSYVAGAVSAQGSFGWSMSSGQRNASVEAGRSVAAQIGVDPSDPIGPVKDALREAGMARISFVVNFFRGGRAVLHLLEFGPAVEATAGGIGLGSLVLVEGALPELWRRQPAPAPHARPAASADPELLERTLRERLPGATGATEAEIADAEARLGIPLPEELEALYRVTRARSEDWGGDWEAAERVFTVVGCYPMPLGQLHIATAATRPLPWIYAATEAASTSPSGAVQALVGSPGWIAFGGDGAGCPGWSFWNSGHRSGGRFSTPVPYRAACWPPLSSRMTGGTRCSSWRSPTSS